MQTETEKRLEILNATNPTVDALIESRLRGTTIAIDSEAFTALKAVIGEIVDNFFIQHETKEKEVTSQVAKK